MAFQFRFGLHRLLASVSITVLSATAAHAQTQGADAPAANTNAANGSGSSSDIIVTATRRKQSLQDVPMSVDVATGQQLQQLNIFDAKDLQQLSPGLQLTNTDGRSNTATLRGIAFDPDQGTSPAVDVYFNEVPSDAQNTFAAIYDIEQIEVLRGPQGALRGRTSPAGAITIRTRRADLNKMDGYVQATGSDSHAYNIQGAVSVPIIEDKLAIRVSGLLDGNRLNQVRNVNRGGEYSRGRTESARISLAYSPTSDINLNLTYQYLHANNRQNAQVVGPGNTPIVGSTVRSGPPAAIDDYIAVHDGVRDFRNTNNQVTLNGDWNVGPVTLSVVGGYQNAKLIQRRDDDIGNAIPGYSTAQGRGAVEPSRIPYVVKMGELRLSSNNDGFWNWGVSAFYYRQTGDTTQVDLTELFLNRADALPDITLPPSSTVVPQDSETKAISINSRFQFTDKLRLEIAARYTDLQSRQVVRTNGVAALDRKHSADPLTGAANLTYEFNRDLTAYLAYGRSFRLGTTDVGVAIRSGIFGPVAADLLDTANETSDSFEAGVKMALFNRRLSLNVATFYQKFSNYITRVRDVPVRYRLPPVDPIRLLDKINANGDATIKGIEGTLSGRPLDNWDFSVSASYVDAHFDNANLPCRTTDAAGNTVILGGGNVSRCMTNRRIADVPNFNLSANTEYRFHMGAFEPFVRALFTYNPAVFSEQAQFEYQSRELLNLYVGLRGDEGRWEITAFAKNLFDQNRITFASPVDNAFIATNTPGAGAFQSGYRFVNATNPREFGVTGMFRF